MNNTVFGKTMEDIGNRRMMDNNNNERKLIKRAAKPYFQSFAIFNENLVAVEHLKVEPVLNRQV